MKSDKSQKMSAAPRTTSSGHRGNESMDWKTDLTNDKHADQKQKKEHSGANDPERRAQSKPASNKTGKRS